MKKIILAIDGMTCSACSNGLEKYLNKQKGIKASVNLVMANATIEYEDDITLEQIEKFVSQAGFKSLGEFKNIKIENKSKCEKLFFIIYTILAILLIYIFMGHMLNLPTILFFDSKINLKNYTVCLFILAILFIIYGKDIFKNGYKNMIHKTPNMDTLVSIGVISSFFYSLYSMFMVFKGNYSYTMNLYFESVAIVIYFLKLGRYIDRVSKDKTKEAIQNLVSITPNKATIKKDGKELEVTIDEIKVGNIVISKPGERIAVDGKIIFGSTHLDESFITGESKPVGKLPGDDVVAGSVNYDGYIEYEALHIGANSTISEIVRLVVEASNTKAKVARFADTVSGYFVPTIIIIATLSFIVYLIMGASFASSLSTFVTVLVVACPCSLGLATPLAIVISEGLCVNNGILVKRSEILEKAQKVDTIVFDKTGTLTYGKLSIAEVINFSDIPEIDLIKLAGSLESKSTHPISKAFLDYMEENKISSFDVDSFENISGYGITGKIGKDKIILGNAKILTKYKIKNNHTKEEKILAKKGNSVIYVVKNKEILGLIGVNDIVRENALDVINTLNKSGIETIMLTGDNKEVSLEIGAYLGISKIYSNILPAKKALIIKELKKENHLVMMCGDGINDSPALATADIGVSVNSGTDIANDSSDVILTKNDLVSIVKLINISKKTIEIIKQNLFWAFFYNILMIPLAMGVLKPFGISLNPMLASIAMTLSSITVILNSLRIKRTKL